jgi:hypothetical protein
MIHTNFDYAMEDAGRLLAMHDAETRRHKGRPSRQLEVLKRAAVIVSVTAWESFIEDAIRVYGMYRLEMAKTPNDVSAWFNSVAQAWLQGHPQPPKIAIWTGSQWKELLKRKLESDLQTLNTASPDNIKSLSKLYVGSNVCESWKWTRTSAKNAAQQLDDLIVLRGELVHRSLAYIQHHPVSSPGRRAQRQHVVDGIRLLKNLVRCTVAGLHEE